jgi:hypothetical protein
MQIRLEEVLLHNGKDTSIHVGHTVGLEENDDSLSPVQIAITYVYKERGW